MTFKEQVFEIADTVASGTPWTFRRNLGLFVDESRAFVKCVIDPGFSFVGNPASTLLQPSVSVNNARTARVYRSIFGAKEPFTSFISFKWAYEGFLSMRIYPEKFEITGQSEVWRATWFTLREAPALLERIVRQGSEIIERNYNLTSERAFLMELPYFGKLPPSFSERQLIEACIGHIAAQDYDWVRSLDRSKFVVRRKEFDALIAALPKLERAGEH